MTIADTHEPAPIPNDRPAIWSLVIADMQARDAEGRRKYGTPLQSHNGRDALVDAYQEGLDLVVYLRQAIEERGAPPVGQLIEGEPGRESCVGCGRPVSGCMADPLLDVDGWKVPPVNCGTFAGVRPDAALAAVDAAIAQVSGYKEPPSELTTEEQPEPFGNPEQLPRGLLHGCTIAVVAYLIGLAIHMVTT